MTEPNGVLRGELDVVTLERLDAAKGVARVEGRIGPNTLHLEHGHMIVASRLDFVLRCFGDETDDLDIGVVGNAKSAEEVSVEAVDSPVVAAPLGGERN